MELEQWTKWKGLTIFNSFHFKNAIKSVDKVLEGGGSPSENLRCQLEKKLWVMALNRVWHLSIMPGKLKCDLKFEQRAC